MSDERLSDLTMLSSHRQMSSILLLVSLLSVFLIQFHPIVFSVLASTLKEDELVTRFLDL